ncbi:VOC family protein [Fodinicola acaciae]|uniref:VOC family protein n=1 Tax=Fodinicola acaciae TaxID=2681555 RepID=UPI0013D63E87|nr:VOC family protein [Fodinicola acaciae]
MTSTVFNVTFDCADPYALASFWSDVTGQPLGDDDHPGDPAAAIAMPAGFQLYFERVPEPKTVKNRVHVCLRPDDRRELEVDRLLALGATIVADRREENGAGWVVFADPEGNEFCVLRSAAEREAMEQANG